jgi:hypothetical protein
MATTRRFSLPPLPMRRLTITGRRLNARSGTSYLTLFSERVVRCSACVTTSQLRLVIRARLSPKAIHGHEVSQPTRSAVRKTRVDSPLAPGSSDPCAADSLPDPRLHVTAAPPSEKPRHLESPHWAWRAEQIRLKRREVLTGRQKHGTTPVALAPGTHAASPAGP